MNIKIFIATHKVYIMPNSEIYYPIWAGAESSSLFKNQIEGDNTGDNMSSKNTYYNELSTLYWGWKNTNAEVKGLVHYRRYFGENRSKHTFKNLILEKDITACLDQYDVIVTPRRRFFFMSAYQHYIYSQSWMKQVHKKDLDTLRKIVDRLYPTYIPALDNVYRSHSAHMLNMFIMRNEMFDNYCNWLFHILKEMETEISRFRVLGAMGEFLLDTYIQTNNLTYIEKPLIELERVPLYSKIFNRLKVMFKQQN